MKPNVRAVVAAVALAHATGKRVGSVMSPDTGLRMIEAHVTGTRVEAFDYDSGCHFDGNMPSLFHYGEGAHVDFEMKSDGSYSGFDYGSGAHFDVAVRGGDADVFDYADGQTYSFSL